MLVWSWSCICVSMVLEVCICVSMVLEVCICVSMVLEVCICVSMVLEYVSVLVCPGGMYLC